MYNRRRYTPEEDSLIIEARSAGERRALALKLGRSYGGIAKRSSLLQQQNKPKRQTISKPTMTAKVRTVKPPFSRPSWFDEAISVIARAAR